MRCQRRKEQGTTGHRRRTESYENAACKVRQRKGFIERECMISGGN